jgi:lipopolysaccharide export system permease protein
MRIDRYLAREILKPLLLVCSVLLLVFMSYSSVRYLADAVAGLLPQRTILALVLLRAGIALEVLLPVTLYLSVVVGLGRLYADTEIVALHALGVAPGRILRVVGAISVLLAVVVGVLSLAVRPWAYRTSYWLQARAEAEFDVDKFVAGRFHEGQDGDRVMFFEELDRSRGEMRRVFVWTYSAGARRVISAARAYQETDPASGGRRLVFVDGHEYRLARTGDRDRVLRFERLAVDLREPAVTPEYRSKSAPTGELRESRNLKDIAELQWRLSTPLVTVLLGMLGVPLSRTVPRQGKYARVLTAVVIYSAYYNLSAVAKTWVEKGVVGPVPGIWWVVALLLVVLLLALRPPRRLWGPGGP